MSSNVVLLDPNSPAFDTIDQAAKGLTDTFDSKGGLEQAGAVVKGPDGKFRYTTAILGEHDNFSMRVRVPH